jgi:subtilisin-like proprotein convertase family protein
VEIGYQYVHSYCFLENLLCAIFMSMHFALKNFYSCLWLAGAGIGIRINDDGVAANHVEFNGKFDVNSSCSFYTPVVADDKHNHGTTCATIAAGSGNNGACAVGVAPNARISACRVIKTESDDILATELDDFSYLYAKMENMHISSNSYSIPSCTVDESSLPNLGSRNRRLQQCPFSSTTRTSPCIATDCAGVDWSNPSPSTACEEAISLHCIISFETDVQPCTNFLDLFVNCEFNFLSMAQQDALSKGVTEGRNGKGIVYIFAGGNDFGSGADVNFAGYQSSRYAISVGAADKSGKHSSFSTGGAALFISAPGGDLDYYTNNLVAFAGGGCTDGGAGTSFAAPVVTGIVALMLETNANLSWRDVQGVLASTATQIQPSDPSWATNSAGLSHSYIYGFGLVNASAAVERSKIWTPLTSEIEIVTDSEQVNIVIPEYPSNAITSTITVNANDSFRIESVIVYLDLLHSSRGDLNIVLTSPSGTSSILSPGQRPENSQNVERWRLMTVRNREESAKGEWTLSVVDHSLGDLSPCIDTLGWSTNLGTLLNEDEVFDCDTFSFAGLCVDGAQGPSFFTVFPGTAGLSDPFLAGTDGLTPDIACCICGGGLPASNLTDTLQSWRLVIYGSDPEAPTTLTNAPTPTSDTSPTVLLPVNQSPASTALPNAPAPSSVMSPIVLSPVISSPASTQAITPSNIGSTSGIASTLFDFYCIGIATVSSIVFIFFQY